MIKRPWAKKYKKLRYSKNGRFIIFLDDDWSIGFFISISPTRAPQIFDFFIISNMPSPIIFALLALCLSITYSLPCLEYQSGACIRCAASFALYNGSCVNKINGCLRYLNESACAECSPLFVLDRSQCRLINDSCNGVAQANITLYQLAAFGDYHEIPLSQLTEDRGFVQCDRMLRSGQYHHFISRSTQPVYFAAFSQLQSWRSYEIIYQASGGGLLLCMTNYDSNSFAVTIQSIVSIGTSQLVENCLSYAPSLQCNYCRQGFHLYKGRCSQDIAGCTNYHGAICLACGGFMLLVQNRCLGECGDLCDTGKIKYFLNQYS